MEVVGVFVQIMNRGRGWMPVMGDVSDIDDQTLEVAQQAYSIGYVVTLLPVQKPDKAFSFGVAPSGTIEGEECAGVTIDHERPSCCFLTDSPQRTSHLLRSVVEPAILNRCAPAGLCEDWHYVAIVDTAIVWCRSVVCQPRRPVAPSPRRPVAPSHCRHTGNGLRAKAGHPLPHFFLRSASMRPTCRLNTFRSDHWPFFAAVSRLLSGVEIIALNSLNGLLLHSLIC